VEGDDTNAALAGFGQGPFDQVAGQLAAPVFRFHIDVEQISAMGGSGVERVRRPVVDHESGSGNHAVSVAGKPAYVLPILNRLGHPRLEVASHDVKNLVVGAAGIHKHAATVMGDELRVSRSRDSGFQHG